MKNIINKYKNYRLVFLAFIFYCSSRLFLFWRYGDLAFGYDTGIYRHYINGYWEKFGQSNLQPLAFSWFSDFFKLLGFSTDAIMFAVYFLLGGAMFWLVYLVAKKYFNDKIALWSVFLFTVSIVQFEFYWWYYYRSFLAMFFLLLALLLFHYRSYWVIPPLILAFCFHPLSTLPVLLGILAMSLFDKNARGYCLIIFGVSIAGSLILNWQDFFGQYLYLQSNSWRAGFDQYGATESTGQFISPWFFVRSALFYSVFGLVGIWQYGKKQKLLFAVFLASLLLALVQVVFYRRLFVWLDLILIIFAGAFLCDWLANFGRKKIITTAIAIFCVLTILSISRYVYSKQPLITKTEWQAIQSAGNFTGSDYILTVSSAYAPWLYGYTDKKVIAPGMLDYNLWNYDQWVKFWTTTSSSEREALLREYNSSPIYLFLGEKDQRFKEILQDDNHFTPLNDYWWRFDK